MTQQPVRGAIRRPQTVLACGDRGAGRAVDASLAGRVVLGERGKFGVACRSAWYGLCHRAIGVAAIRLVNTRNQETVVEDLEVADTWLRRFLGLMGRTGLPEGAGLWLDPCSSIHMFFMRFAIDVVYLDRECRVVKLVRDLRPWRLSAGLGAHSVVELPAGVLANMDIEKGDLLKTEDTEL